MKSLQLYKRMFLYLGAYWPWFLLSICLSFLVVNFEALSLWFGASLIQTLFEPEKLAAIKPAYSMSNLNAILKYWTYQAIKRDNPLDSLKIVCLLMAITFLAKNALIYVKTLVMTKLNLNIVRDMRNQLYGHTLKLPVTYYDRTRSGNIISLIVNDVSSINASMTGTFDKLFTEPMRIIFWISMLFIINTPLTFAVFLIFPVLGFIISRIGKTVRRRSKRVLEHMAGLLSILHETVNCIRVVKMFNMNDPETQKFRTENNRYNFTSYKSTSIAAIASPLTEVLGVAVVIILLWYGGQQVLKNDGFGAEDFVRFLIFMYSTFTPLKTLSVINNSLQKGFAAAERVFEVLDHPGEKLETPTPDSIPQFSTAINFTNVTFAYPGTEEQVIRDVSFSMNKGDVVALVGPSGSGKTTILDLLPRFYDVTAGSISIDGCDTREMDLVGLRHIFGIVAQETVLFNDTVANNISYGIAHANRDHVIAAAKASNAWEFIEKLPLGLETVIGERGVMLSGGQRQRLSIARALLKNPPILILDEATSALDTESERLVQTAINTLMQNRTVLVVAHRLSTVQHADRILVIDRGKIVEQGTHEELLALNKRYKYFYDIQFASPAQA